MTEDEELLTLEENIVDTLAHYREFCEKLELDFDDNLQDLIERSKE